MQYNDKYFMRHAISLAIRGRNTLSNPRVGCVIVNNGSIVGRGYHNVYGGDHAEIIALEDAGNKAKDGSAYVTLEPCSHYGKTPPCAPRLVSAGIRKVVIGSLDPNPLVNGRGIEILKQGHVEVIEGVLKKECDWINRGFLKRIRKGRPWITLKAAVGLDAKMCLSNGESKWITSSWSRRIAHLHRSDNDAVIVGKGTALADDPRLNVRTSFGRSPLKVLIDPELEISPSAKIFESGSCLVYSRLRSKELERRAILFPQETRLCFSRHIGKKLDLGWIVNDLAEQGINYLLVEGGPTLISSFLENDLADEIVLFSSPRIMGQGIGFSDGIRFQCMENTISVRDVRICQIGEDLMLEGRISCSQDW